MNHNLKRATCLTLAILAATTFAWGNGLNLTATLEPAEITFGEAAQPVEVTEEFISAVDEVHDHLGQRDLGLFFPQLPGSL